MAVPPFGRGGFVGTAPVPDESEGVEATHALLSAMCQVKPTNNGVSHVHVTQMGCPTHVVGLEAIL